MVQAWISMSAQLAVIFNHEFQPLAGVGGARRGGVRSDHLLLSFFPLSFSTHLELTDPGPRPGLNPFHQSDLREKHSSVPEKRSHIFRE